MNGKRVCFSDPPEELVTTGTPRGFLTGGRGWDGERCGGGCGESCGGDVGLTSCLGTSGSREETDVDRKAMNPFSARDSRACVK